uniref:Uncharacterized protein n=1 Tax=Anguilla anguilla TaxID=7936 RepID=A0A0E9V7H0_ANGAN
MDITELQYPFRVSRGPSQCYISGDLQGLSPILPVIFSFCHAM